MASPYDSDDAPLDDDRREASLTHQTQWKRRRVLTVVVSVLVTPIIVYALWVPLGPAPDYDSVDRSREVITQEDVRPDPAPDSTRPRPSSTFPGPTDPPD